jgi:hypothetical protein
MSGRCGEQDDLVFWPWRRVCVWPARHTDWHSEVPLPEDIVPATLLSDAETEDDAGAAEVRAVPPVEATPAVLRVATPGSAPRPGPRPRSGLAGFLANLPLGPRRPHVVASAHPQPNALEES